MSSWIPVFAWRDSRGSRAKLALFIASMVLGVAALVSINSFGDNLGKAIDEESKTLLGADLSFESSKPFSDATEAIIDSLGGLQSRRTSFSSMAYFPKSNSARLSTIRGHEPGFPYYGEIETDPPSAAASYLTEHGALVDGTLMAQYNVQIGDTVRIGTISYPVSGRLIRTPRESAAIMLFSPRIYIPLSVLDSTLLVSGSRADYEVYFRFPDGRDAEAIAESLKERLRAERVGIDTVQEVREGWDDSLTNLYRFLGLVGFMALLLGSLGVASSIHVYVKQRIQTVAILRCYGASSWSTFGVYLLQTGGMGIIGVIAGSTLGIAIQSLIPVILGDFLPVYVSFSISWPAVFLGSGIGFGVTLLFAMMPLLSVRTISPLAALRADYTHENTFRKSFAWWAMVAVTALGVVVFAVLQAPSVMMGIGYSATLLAVFLLLAGTARGIMILLARHPRSSMSYVLRQGIANLYRPHNQTMMMILSLGLGTFLVSTMLLSEHTLLGQIDLASSEGRPNLIFFDIQPNQVDSIVDVVTRHGLPIIDEVAMVTMRLSSVGGKTIDELRADTTFHLSWAHRREYRSTYRDALTDSETLVEGVFVGQYDGSGIIPVSIERDIATQLDVDIGDELIFDIQGVEIITAVSSIRTVDWRRMQTNFFFVFPEGAINNAPAFHVLMTRSDSEEISAAVQSAVVKQSPNISSFDISVVLSVFDAIFSRIAFVVRFMALFSIITGLIVVSGAVFVSRFQRIEESVLLKTLGASRRVVLRIMSVEYFVLGLVASLTGILLSLAAAWGVSRFVFNTELVVKPVPLLLVMVIVIGLTLVIGHLNSRGIYDREALEVLRNEA